MASRAAAHLLRVHNTASGASPSAAPRPSLAERAHKLVVRAGEKATKKSREAKTGAYNRLSEKGKKRADKAGKAAGVGAYLVKGAAKIASEPFLRVGHDLRDGWSGGQKYLPKVVRRGRDEGGVFGPFDGDERDEPRTPAEKAQVKACGWFWFFVGVVGSAAFYIWLFQQGFLAPPCPSFQGRVCNGAGNTCTQYGKCLCADILSGVDCSESACPLYDSSTRSFCGSRGLCSPFLQNQSMVPPACRWVTPDPSNGFAPKHSPGWTDPGCTSFLNQNYQAILNSQGDPALLRQIPFLSGTPTCACFGAWDGLDCSVSSCPLDLELNVCSRNGNKSVSLFSNVTDGTGNGCQCRYVFNFLDPSVLIQIPQSMLLVIRDQYTPEFAQPMCGFPLVLDGVIFIVKGGIWEFTTSATKCFCDQDHYGDGCQYGKCPANPVSNQACSFNGHPFYGFGYNPRTLRVLSEWSGQENKVICAPGSSMCGSINRCLPTPSLVGAETFDLGDLCSVPQTCPEGAPYRCPSGACASAAANNPASCALGYTFGTLDPFWLDLKRRQIRCVLDTLESQQTCFPGPSAFFSKNQTRFTSASVPTPCTLHWFSVGLFNPSPIIAQVRVQYAGMAWDFTLQPLEQKRVYDSVVVSEELLIRAMYADTVPVTQVKVAAGGEPQLFQAFPLPFLDALPLGWTDIRLRGLSDGNFYRATVTGFQPVLTPSSLSPPPPPSVSVIPRFPDGSALNLAGVRVLQSACVAGASSCAWTLEGVQIIDGFGGFACFSFGPQTWTIETSFCAGNNASVPIFTLYPTLTLRTFSIPPSSFLLQNYSVQLSSGANWNFTVQSNVLLDAKDIELLTTCDTNVPCVCEPPLISRVQNYSQQELQWTSQVARKRDVYVQGAFVAARFLVDGVMVFGRGSVVAQLSSELVEVAVPGWGLLRLPPNQLGAITRNEFLSGYDDCDTRTFVGRCPTGQCTFGQVLDFQVQEECSCTIQGASATCECSSTTTCFCDLGSECVCQGVDDSEFEAVVLASLQDSLGACSCFDFPNMTYVGFASSVQQGWNLTLASSRQLLSLETSPCFSLQGVLGVNQLFRDKGTGLSFNVSCVDGVQEMVVVQGATPYLELDLQTHAPVQNVTLVWSPGGLSLFDAMPAPTWTASSNPDTAYKAQYFDNTWWESSPSFVLSPVWIQLSFVWPVTVARFLLDIRSAAIALPIGTTPSVLTVRIAVQGLTVDEKWTDLAFWASDAFYPLSSERVVVNSTRPSLLISAARIISLFPFSMNEFVPLVDQTCECRVNSSAEGAFLLTPAVDLTTMTQYELLQQDLLQNNFSDPNCVCTDDCLIQFNGGFFPPPSSCVDTLFYEMTTNVSSTITETTQLTNLTFVQIYAQAGFTTAAHLNVASFQLFDVFGATQEWILWSSATSPPNQSYVDTRGPLLFYQLDPNEFFTSDLAYQYAVFYTNNFGLVQNTPPERPWRVNDTANWLFYTSTFYQVETPGLTPNALCPSGRQCSICGPSSRYLPTTPGLSCSLTPLQQKMQEDIDEGVVTPQYRLLGEFLTTGAVVQLKPINRTQISLDSQCTQQVCVGVLGVRCANGLCAASQADCTAVTYRFSAGNGCTTNDISSTQYFCACAEGFGGLACEYSTAVPMVQRNVPINTYQEIYCFAQGQPLTERPPVTSFLSPVNTYKLPDMLRINYAYHGGITSPNDVQNLEIRPWGRAYGGAFQRLTSYVDFATGVATQVVTDCPCARNGLGHGYNLLSDDVYARDPATGLVTKWTQYFDSTLDQFVEFPWNSSSNVCSYDGFPSRCPNNGWCVQNPAYCPVVERLFPPCNNHGSCTAFGTCVCDNTMTTFILNAFNTKQASCPYFYDSVRDTCDPVVWNEINNVWREYGPFQCQVRNCLVQDCSPPMGCFPGTATLSFADKLVQCTANAQHQNFAGTCATSQQACSRGDVTPMTICSSNGILRLRDYRDPPEYFCQCGTPLSLTVNISDVHESVQLSPNGFAGPACTTYFCTDPTQTGTPIFSPRDPVLGVPYTDLGVQLPGKYIGFCGSPIGPDPADEATWAACCPEQATAQRWDRCNLRPCTIGGKLQCLSGEQCQVRGGVPLVYACNNHGTPRADGTPLCAYDSTTGQGFVDDFTRFDHPNCYAQLTCPVCQLNGAVCCTQDPTNPASWVTLPRDPFWAGQAEVMMARYGFDFDNETLFNWAMDPPARNQIVVQACADQGLIYDGAVASLGSCICVFPNEDCAHPTGMAPYCGTGISFLKAFAAPYLLPPTYSDYPGYSQEQVEATLTSAIFSTVPSAYIQMLGNTALTITFDAAKTLTAVRVFIPTQLPTTTMFVRDMAGDDVCPPQVVPITQVINVGWQWVTVFCVTLYRAVHFQTEFSQGYLLNCADISTQTGLDICLAWEQSVCDTLPGAVFVGPDSLATLRGCTLNACCVPVETLETSPQSQAQLVFADNILLQVVQWYGYGTAVETMPPTFAAYLATQSGYPVTSTPDYTFVKGSLANDKSYYYLPTSSPTGQPIGGVDWATAVESGCPNTGGKLAATNEVYDTGNPTEPFIGQAIPVGKVVWVNAHNVLPGSSNPIPTQAQTYGCIFKLSTPIGYWTEFASAGQSSSQYNHGDYIAWSGLVSVWPAGYSYTFPSLFGFPYNDHFVNGIVPYTPAVANLFSSGILMNLFDGLTPTSLASFTLSYMAWIALDSNLYITANSVPAISPTPYPGPQWYNWYPGPQTLSVNFNFHTPSPAPHPPVPTPPNTVVPSLSATADWMYSPTPTWNTNTVAFAAMTFYSDANCGGFGTPAPTVASTTKSPTSTTTAPTGSTKHVFMKWQTTGLSDPSDPFFAKVYGPFGRLDTSQQWSDGTTFDDTYSPRSVVVAAMCRIGIIVCRAPPQSTPIMAWIPCINAQSPTDGISDLFYGDDTYCDPGSIPNGNNQYNKFVSALQDWFTVSVGTCHTLTSASGHTQWVVPFLAAKKTHSPTFPYTYPVTSPTYMRLSSKYGWYAVQYVQTAPYYGMPNTQAHTGPTPTPSVYPPGYTQVMGPWDDPGMCQSATYDVFMACDWNNPDVLDSQDYFGIYFLPCYGFHSDAPSWTGSAGTLTGLSMYVGDSFAPNPFTNTSPNPKVWYQGKLVDCSVVSLPTPDCASLEPSQPNSFMWNLEMWPVTGDQWPGVQTVQQNAHLGPVNAPTGITQNAMYILMPSPNPSFGSIVNPNDGVNELQGFKDRSVAQFEYQLYANQVLLNAGNKGSAWDYADCLTAFNDFDGQGGFLWHYICQKPVSFICQYDYTQYVCQNGMNGPGYGYNFRPGGYPRPGVTCFDAVPDANASLNPVGALCSARLHNGTINLLPFDGAIAWDNARAYCDANNISLVPTLPGVMEQWFEGVSTMPGFVSPGEPSDSVSGFDLSLTTTYPASCGLQVSVETGVPAYFLGANTDACSTYLNAPVVPSSFLSESSLPSVLLPVDPNTQDARFVPQCGRTFWLGSYYRNDKWGLSTRNTTQTDYWYSVLPVGNSLVQTVLQPNLARFSFYNTGKTQNYFVFQPNTTTTLTGFVSSTCATCSFGSSFLVDIWISPLVYTYEYPSTRLVLASVSVTNNGPVVAYSGSTNGSWNPNITAFQSVGFDFYGVTPGSEITLTNPLATTDESVARCTSGAVRVPLPKPAPLPYVEAQVPYHTCVTTYLQQHQLNAPSEGECLCGVGGKGPWVGDACDGPAYVGIYGKLLAGGGFGVGGLALTPIGTKATTASLSSGKYGTYFYKVGGVTRVGVKGLDKGRVLFTRTTRTTSKYPSITRLTPTLGAANYIQLTAIQSYSDINVASDAAVAADSVIPACVTQDLCNELFTLDIDSMGDVPVFLDLVQNTVPVSGNADWNWASMGFLFSECADPATCGTQMHSPVVLNTGGWTQRLVDTINVRTNNLAYHSTGSFLFDGSMVFQNFPGTVQLQNPATDGSYVYVWVDPSTCTGFTPVEFPQCASAVQRLVQAGSLGTLLLFVASCPNFLTTPATINVVASTSCRAAEIQLFNTQQTTRPANGIYPYW